jgi:predicted molibdopterin-dependent oxidoreductase YjgC
VSGLRHGARATASPPTAKPLGGKAEFDLREAGTWDESKQGQVDTVCPYCGVGCNLTLHVQDGDIVKVTSPDDHDVTRGNLCVKGRFGYEFVQNRPAK